MQRRSAKYLEDILDAGSFILEATGGLDQGAYEGNRLLRQAVERNFEVIGEAVRRLSATDATTADRLGDYRVIVDFRNVLIHGYDLIDNALVWSAIREHLPALVEATRQLLSEFSGTKGH